MLHYLSLADVRDLSDLQTRIFFLYPMHLDFPFAAYECKQVHSVIFASLKSFTELNIFVFFNLHR